MTLALLLPTILTFLLLTAIITDIKSFRIPNWLNLILLILYPIALIVFDTAMQWQYGLLGFTAIFAVGYVLFIFNIAGGGDVKLLAVLGLWIGWGQSLVTFILFMAIAGGLFTLLLISLRKSAPYIAGKLKGMDATIPRVLSYGEPVPYAVAIGVVFIYMLWAKQLPIYV